MGSLRVATLFGLLALGSLASAQDVKLWVEGDRLSADVSETAVVSEQALLASVAYLTGAEGPEVNAEVSREVRCA